LSDPPNNSDPLRDLIDHYEQVDEDSRLSVGWFQLEFARTQELLTRYLKPAPGVVVDVGGGSGAYSCWLASLGYKAHLVDPVPKHIKQAVARSARQARPLATMRVGDARHLEQADNFADAVLLLGPLYHLTRREERIAALREAFRVLRPGGLLFGAAISRFASLFDSLASGFFEDRQFEKILEQDLADGQHRNPTANSDYFTTAFFHRPEELADEVKEAGFESGELVAIEGPGWVARDFTRLWSNQRQRSRLLDCIRKVEREPAILGASSHLMAMARK
jgi:ubiquinone/menaquinone biosynthesis C-methylase UbiE